MSQKEFNISDYKGLVIFELSGIKICSNLFNISSIYKAQCVQIPSEFSNKIITPVVINYKEYPLLNLQILLNLQEIKLGSDCRLLQHESDGKNFLILVEKIDLIVTIDSKFLETVKTIPPKIDSEFIIGSFDFGSGEILMIDFDLVSEKCLQPKSPV